MGIINIQPTDKVSMAHVLSCYVFSLNRDVSDLTGFPEMLGGRVKTLHPAVHAGMLLLISFQSKRELRVGRRG